MKLKQPSHREKAVVLFPPAISTIAHIVLYKLSLFVYVASYLSLSSYQRSPSLSGDSMLISLSQEVELWEASCYGQLDKLISLINAGTNVNVATWVSASFCAQNSLSLLIKNQVNAALVCMLVQENIGYPGNLPAWCWKTTLCMIQGQLLRSTSGLCVQFVGGCYSQYHTVTILGMMSSALKPILKA